MIVTSISGSPLAGIGETYRAERHGVRVTNLESETVRSPGRVHLHASMFMPGARTTAQASEHEPHAPLGHPVAAVVEARGRAELAALTGLDRAPIGVFHGERDAESERDDLARAVAPEAVRS